MNINKNVGPNKRNGRENFQNLINMMFLIKVWWEEKLPNFNKCASLLLGTLEYLYFQMSWKIPAQTPNVRSFSASWLSAGRELGVWGPRAGSQGLKLLTDDLGLEARTFLTKKNLPTSSQASPSSFRTKPSSHSHSPSSFATWPSMAHTERNIWSMSLVNEKEK